MRTPLSRRISGWNPGSAINMSVVDMRPSVGSAFSQRTVSRLRYSSGWFGVSYAARTRRSESGTLISPAAGSPTTRGGGPRTGSMGGVAGTIGTSGTSGDLVVMDVGAFGVTEDDVSGRGLAAAT